MNNQNDPWDIELDPRGRGAGAGDGQQWTYALLVPILGLAICRSIWERRCEREIQEVKAQYEKKLHEEREFSQFQRAKATLKELENQLLERQNAYCSCIRPQYQRLEMEQNMLMKVVKDPVLPELDLESDLKYVFENDTHCAPYLNKDKRKNGFIMWEYLKKWQDTVQKHKWAE